jgi:hypothetical protein
MTEFWSDAAANLVGTFAGAGLALMSSWLFARNAGRKNEVRLLQSIIDRLSRSRVFTHESNTISGSLSPDHWDDLRRSTASILASRDYIGYVMSNLEPTSQAASLLEDMLGACALYLRSVESDPTTYARASVDLREYLHRAVQGLCAQNSGLRSREPGETAFLVN